MTIFRCNTLSSCLKGNLWRYMVACLALFWIGQTGQVHAQEKPHAAKGAKEIRFAAFQGIYPNVNRKEGRMALELLMQKTIVKKSYPYTVALVFLDPGVDPVEVIQKGGHHFVTLSSIDYYKYRTALHLHPILIPSKTEQPTEQLLLLAANDQTLADIHRKDERSLVLETGTSGDLSKIWLDTSLLGQGYSDSIQFFTHVRRVSKPNRAVLPVFFNQADACIVSRHALDVIKELNPQIGRQIKILHQSHPLVRLMICATDKPSQEDIEKLVRESTRLHEHPETKQALTILQLERFIKIKPQDLITTEELLAKHNRLTAGKIK